MAGPPLAHAPTHKSGGTDPVKLDELAAPTDITTLNASPSAHGLLPKLSNTATQYLDGTGAWSATGASGTFTVSDGASPPSNLTITVVNGLITSIV